MPVATAPPPLVSVLLPVRDGADTLPEALESIRGQTLTTIEILAVDDGSRDESHAILQEVAKADPRIPVFRQGPLGIVPALELARRNARGRYLARMDADDLALPGRLKAQVDLLESDSRTVLAGTRVAYFPREKVRVGALRYEGWINGLTTHETMERDLFVECPVPHPTFLLRAEAVELVGGYRERDWPEDYDLVFRLWEAGGRLAKVPAVLLKWREGGARLSRTHGTYSEEAFRRCKVHFLLRTHLDGGRGVVVWGAGPVGKAFARELQAQGGRLEAFVDLDPRKIGQVIHGVPVVTPGDVGAFGTAFSVAAVGKGRAREEIRSALGGMGFRELEDFVAVA